MGVMGTSPAGEATRWDTPRRGQCSPSDHVCGSYALWLDGLRRSLPVIMVLLSWTLHRIG